MLPGLKLFLPKSVQGRKRICGLMVTACDARDWDPPQLLLYPPSRLCSGATLKTLQLCLGSSAPELGVGPATPGWRGSPLQASHAWGPPWDGVAVLVLAHAAHVAPSVREGKEKKQTVKR